MKTYVRKLIKAKENFAFWLRKMAVKESVKTSKSMEEIEKLLVRVPIAN